MDQARIVLVGRLSRDPEFFGEGDTQRAVFSIATNRGRGDNRKSSFLDCIAWGKRADIMRDYSKGMGIFVTGDVEQDTYTNKEGQKRSRVQVNVGSITATTSTRKTSGEGSEVSAGATGATGATGAVGEDGAPIPF